MRCTALRWLAAIRSLCLGIALCGAIAQTGRGEPLPQYGGVLRVELRAASVNLNPAKWKAGSAEFATNERLAELLYDRLVTLDNYGRFQPQLATEWSRDAAARKWQFTLRQGVKFSDGTTLTPAVVVAALQPLLPQGVQATATSSGIAIQSPVPTDDLLEILASGPYFIYKRSEGGILQGTGPFSLESAPASGREANGASAEGSATPTQHLRFRFNGNCWSGRPYLDAIEVTLGVPPLKALLDLQLGKAELGELSVETAKRAQQANLKFWASAPLTLYALRFSGEGKAGGQQAIREAISFSIDRGAMSRVLLQKQAEAADSFLPQWLSGYAFLFGAESNLESAKQLRMTVAPGAAGVAQPLRVGVDATNELSKLVAERVAVDARAAGLTLQIVRAGARIASDGSGAKAEPDAQIISLRYTSLSPRVALEELVKTARLKSVEDGAPAEADARYAWEKQMIEERHLVPVVTVPDFAAADGRVRNWSPSAWGEWRLADVWLEQGEGNRAFSIKSEAGGRQ